jgi:putative endonuclease
MIYYLYILECSNNSLYIGYTTDIERRYREHVEGSAKCKYTRSFPPKQLAACWQFDTKIGEILRLEKKLKQLSKHDKHALIRHPEDLDAITNLKFEFKKNMSS